jgi:hypothetical protein
VANVTDNVGVSGAVLSWSAFGDNPGGSVAMSPGGGNSWTATIGGFYPGTASWTVTATDAAGNTGKRSGRFSVSDCPSSTPSSG